MPLSTTAVESPCDATLAAAAAGGRTAFWMRLRVAGGLALAGCGLFAVDLPAAAWWRVHRLPGDLARLVDLSEVFAHGLGVAVLLVVAVVLDPALRRFPTARGNLLRLVAATYSGGLVVDTIKAVVPRVRPRAADFTELGSVFGTFDAAALAGPAAPVGLLGKTADLMSFPSGHAATAAGLATALSWMYPQGTPLFAAIAASAAFQRVASSAHYPSDVAFGAAIGVAAAACCLGRSRPAPPPP